MGRSSGIAWDKMDWRLRDVDIAEKVGCSRERVRQVRAEMGMPQSPIWHKRINTVVDRIKSLNTAKLVPEQVAQRTGCGPEYALQVMKSLGKSFVKPPDKRMRHKYSWDSIRLSEWQRLTDVQIAKRLGVPNPAVVTQWRRRKGIVKSPASRARKAMVPKEKAE